MGPIEAARVEVDYFQGLLVRSGVPPHLLPKDGRRLTPEQAASLLSWLISAEVPLRDFGPWRMAAHLLAEVLHRGQPLTRHALHERMRRFSGLLVLRPDGFLVRATTGSAVQHVGQVTLVRGALRAEGFEVGPFYTVAQGRFLFPVDSDLEVHPDALLAGVYAPDEDTLGPALEGAGQAVVDSVMGIVSLVLHFDEALLGLAQLPGAVRVLLENSPEYWEHFRSLPHGAQVRAVSRLLTSILLTCGTAGAGSARLASLSSRMGLPVLSLSAEGSLALRSVALPAGQLVSAVGSGTSAFFVLHMAQTGAGSSGGGGSSKGKHSQPPPSGGPGKWVQVKEYMLERARKYQAQVTGAPEGWTYRISKKGDTEDYADFDGFQDGVLLEAKGPGYAKFIDEDLEPLWFFKGGDRMLDQAQRQSKVAQSTPIRWIVSEEKLADYLRKLFDLNNLEEIEVIHIPVRPWGE